MVRACVVASIRGGAPSPTPEFSSCLQVPGSDSGTLAPGIAASAPDAHNAGMPEPATLGREFAMALAEKDFHRIAALLHPQIDFKGLTPNRRWEASDPDSVVTGVLRQWFEEDDEIEGLLSLETDAFADRERVGYRFGVRNPEGRFVVEQQVYLSERDGRIAWMRSVCSGFRPVD
jgi:hypothetical protein